MKDSGPMDNYASVHRLPQQRCYNLLCLAYAADPKTFADVTNNMMTRMTEKGFLPQRRAVNCGYEFHTFDQALKMTIGTYIDRQMAEAVMDATWFVRAPSRRPPL